MPIARIQAPDGRIMRIEADTPEQAMAIAKQTLSSSAAAADARKMVTAQPAALRAANRGASFGFDDELDAAAMAAKTGVQNLGKKIGIGQGKPYTAGQAYDSAMSVRKDEDAKFTKDHPVQSLAAEVAPAFATMRPSVGAIRSGAAALRELPVIGGLLGGEGLGAVSGRAAATGGLLGGLSGAGNSPPGHRTAGTGRGVLAGAAIGGAAPSAVNAAGSVVRAGGRAIGAVRPAQIAFDKISAALRRDGATPDQIHNAANEWMRTGASSPSFMDVVRNMPNGGESTTGLIRGAALKAGPGRSAARTYTNEVAGNLQDRVIDRTRRLTPDEQRPAQVVADDLAERQGAQARSDYRGPYAEPVQIDMGMARGLEGAPGRASMQRARAAAEAHNNDEQIAEIDRLLAGDFFTPVSAGTLDRVRIAMGERATNAGRRGANDIRAGLAGREGMIDGGLDSVEGLATARANYAELQRQREALETGRGGLNAAPDEFAQSLNGSSPASLQAAGVGYRQSLVDAMGNPTEGATGAINRVGTSNNQGQNLSTVFGPDEAQNYQGALRNEGQRLDNARFINPNFGSPTAGRVADDIDGFTPTKANLAKLLMDKLSNLPVGGLNDQERGAIVQSGVGQFDPQTVRRLEQELQRRFRIGAGAAVIGSEEGGRQ